MAKATIAHPNLHQSVYKFPVSSVCRYYSGSKQPSLTGWSRVCFLEKNNHHHHQQREIGKSATNAALEILLYTSWNTCAGISVGEISKSEIARSRGVCIYSVKANVKLSFPEDLPIYTAINIGQESLHSHQQGP